MAVRAQPRNCIQLDVVLEQPEKVRWELVYRWACDTVKTYLDKFK